MAIVELRSDTHGRAYYRRKPAAGMTPMEALRCLKGAYPMRVYKQLVRANRTEAASPVRASSLTSRATVLATVAIFPLLGDACRTFLGWVRDCRG
jgi:hypothetical protein